MISIDGLRLRAQRDEDVRRIVGKNSGRDTGTVYASVLQGFLASGVCLKAKKTCISCLRHPPLVLDEIWKSNEIVHRGRNSGCLIYGHNRGSRLAGSKIMDESIDKSCLSWQDFLAGVVQAKPPCAVHFRE